MVLAQQGIDMVCPKCGSKKVSSTLVYYTGKDKNTVRCLDCGEEGISWEWKAGKEELLVEKMNKNKESE